jgi:type IV pilus assembly protein PilX
VLLVGLVMLMVAAFLGMAAIRSVILQERLAGGFASYNLAFQSAEAALRAGEQAVMSGPPALCTTGGWFSVLSCGVGAPEEESSWDSASNFTSVNAVDYYGSSWSQPGESHARYMVERQMDIAENPADVGVGLKPMLEVYKTFSYGQGISPEVKVVLQSTYVHKP